MGNVELTPCVFVPACGSPDEHPTGIQSAKKLKSANSGGFAGCEPHVTAPWLARPKGDAEPGSPGDAPPAVAANGFVKRSASAPLLGSPGRAQHHHVSRPDSPRKRGLDTDEDTCMQADAKVGGGSFDGAFTPCGFDGKPARRIQAEDKLAEHERLRSLGNGLRQASLEPKIDEKPSPVPILKKGYMSTPDLSQLNRGMSRSVSKGNIKFVETVTIVKIDSHKDLTQVERDSYYYQREDMHSFVRHELQRRGFHGIKSTSALSPEAEAVGEIEDEGTQGLTF
eukprot:CAMPEP_0172635766 /NCGR_PEP_ID=MMETSP1068-20121228/200921_1 /TAXON_ID=35684 /ORGANISM="Pseudopedinella elastica, Strain CCMP716" /LENGTH=281 /DNA_ID=CAMNT_0013448075 /DNA_START=176 /DNA_END=1021 /DNA_ORIENTATION=-